MSKKYTTSVDGGYLANNHEHTAQLYPSSILLAYATVPAGRGMSMRRVISGAPQQNWRPPAKKALSRPEPRDLAGLEKAVNDAAGKAGALWISFIVFATLLIITTGAVTHRHLLLEKALKLPGLGVDVPLISYFIFAPLFFVVFHFYLLLQLEGLAVRTRAYSNVLHELFPGDAAHGERQLLRQRLDSNIFVQFLIGARARRTGGIG
jgi:hypothetical protein